MDDLKHLEREVELLKELLELKTKLLELDKNSVLDEYKKLFKDVNKECIPYPVYPQYPSYPNDWWRLPITWCGTGAYATSSTTSFTKEALAECTTNS